MRVLGAIIAGGQSSRMGGVEKAFIDFEGRPLIAHIVETLAKQTELVVINANGDPARFKDIGCTIIGDPPEFIATPIAGLAAVLQFAADHGFDAVVSAPSDTPFLPDDLVARLSGNGAAIACSDEQDHYLTGYWPVELALMIPHAASGNAIRRMQDWVTLAKARRVPWPATSSDPFFNINTPDDLAKARAWLKDRP